MYIWKVKSLINDLKADKVTEKEKFKYLLVNIIFNSYLSSYHNHALKHYYMYVNFIVFVVTIIGLYACYKANRQGDDKDFIGRFICLIVPINVRLIAFLPIVLLIICLIFTRPGTISIDIYGLLFILIFGIIQYYWTRSCISDIALKRDSGKFWSKVIKE